MVKIFYASHEDLINIIPQNKNFLNYFMFISALILFQKLIGFVIQNLI